MWFSNHYKIIVVSCLNCYEIHSSKCHNARKGNGFYSILVLVGLTAQLVSCADFNHNVECGPTDTFCECDADATSSFMWSMFSPLPSMTAASRTPESNLYCNEENVCIEKSKLCTDPITVDGKTYKMLSSS